MNVENRQNADRTAFRESYQRLEARMKLLAEADGDVFLPNPQLSRPVDYLLIGMEPSLGRWARSRAEADAKVGAGFRNFLSSIEDFILHFCIRRYLCSGSESYGITDLSKGAMLVEQAGVARRERYERWYGLLLEEVALVAAPNAGIFAVGKEVAKHLTKRAFPRPFTALIHYSGLAASARAAGIVGHESEFEEFRASLRLESILATADEVLNASVPQGFRDETLTRLGRTELSDSRKQLAFNYKLAFERHKQRDCGQNSPHAG